MIIRTFYLAAAVGFVAAPTAADTGSSFYVGVEGGPTLGRVGDVDEVVELAGAAAATEYDDVLSVDYKRGHDIGISSGYDLGPLRVELEVAHKRARLKPLEPDENFDNFIGAVPGLTDDDLDLPGKMSVASAMINGLIDVGIADRLTVYGGGGYGRTWARAVGDEDSAWGWQWIAGVRYAVSQNVEIGLKHRYFNSGIVKLQNGPRTIAGNGQLTPEIEGKYRTRSLLVGLHFNF